MYSFRADPDRSQSIARGGLGLLIVATIAFASPSTIAAQPYAYGPQQLIRHFDNDVSVRIAANAADPDLNFVALLEIPDLLEGPAILSGLWVDRFGNAVSGERVLQVMADRDFEPELRGLSIVDGDKIVVGYRHDSGDYRVDVYDFDGSLESSVDSVATVYRDSPGPGYMIFGLTTPGQREVARYDGDHNEIDQTSLRYTSALPSPSDPSFEPDASGNVWIPLSDGSMVGRGSFFDGSSSGPAFARFDSDLVLTEVVANTTQTAMTDFVTNSTETEFAITGANGSGDRVVQRFNAALAPVGSSVTVPLPTGFFALADNGDFVVQGDTDLPKASDVSAVRYYDATGAQLGLTVLPCRNCEPFEPSSHSDLVQTVTGSTQALILSSPESGVGAVSLYYLGEPACGDSTVNGSEECDDGNSIFDDGCFECEFQVCGNGSTEAGEQCDDGGTAPGDGCDASCRTEDTASGDPGAGGTIETTEAVTADSPVGTAVTTPNAGTVTIVETSGTSDAFTLLGQSIVITAPAASAGDPLVLVFQLDASAVPGGESEATISVFRDGTLVADCLGASTIGADDPCVSAREVLAGGDDEGDVRLTVLTTQASTWNLGTVCGDGNPNAGEACDDGNAARGDGCAPSCDAEIEQTVAQAKCLTGAAKAALGAEGGHVKRINKCLGDVGRGRASDVPACLAGAKVVAAASKAYLKAAGAIDRCAPADHPDFAFQSIIPSDLGAAPLEAAELFLGDDLTAAVVPSTEKDDARCQKILTKGLEKYTRTASKGYQTCMKLGLSARRGPALVESDFDVGTCVSTAFEGKTLTAATKFGAARAKSCQPASLPIAAPGDCSGELDTAFDACALATANCGFCRSVESFTGVEMDCDGRDNGVADGSCPSD